VRPFTDKHARAAPGIAERARAGEPGAALVVGLGGGGLPAFLSGALGLDVDSVELDAAVLGLARRHFGLSERAERPRLAVRGRASAWALCCGRPRAAPVRRARTVHAARRCAQASNR